MHITRRKTRQIRVGKVKIGGDAPIAVQSMCSTDTRDVKATVEQIKQLEAVGFEPAGDGPAEFAAFMNEESKKWADVAKKAGIKPM